MPNTSVDPDPISAAVDISTESTNEIIRIGNSIGTTELDIDSGSRGIDIKSWSGGDINLYASTGSDPTGSEPIGTANINITSSDIIQIGTSPLPIYSRVGHSTVDTALPTLNPQIVLKTSKDATEAIKLHATVGGIDIDADGPIAIDSITGSISVGGTLADGQTLTLGRNGATEMNFSPHDAAGSEKISITNTAGNATDAIKLDARAGGVDIDCLGTLSLDTAGGDIEIGANANAGDIKIGTNDTARTITIGKGTGISKLDFDAGTGGVDIDCLGTSGVLSLDTAGGDIEIGANTNAGDINIGTNATARTITIGDVDGGLAGGNNVFIHGSVHIDAHTSYGSYVSLHGEGTTFTSAVDTFYNSIDWYDGSATKVFKLPNTDDITGKATVVYNQSIWPAAGTSTITFQCDRDTKLRHIVYPKKNSAITGAIEIFIEAIGRKEFIYTPESTSSTSGLLMRGQSIIFVYMGTQAGGWGVKFNPEMSLYHHTNNVEGAWSFGSSGY
jgi:hypothetical protein